MNSLDLEDIIYNNYFKNYNKEEIYNILIELNKYILGVISSENPIIKRFYLGESIYNSLIFIPNYYSTTFLFLKNSIRNNTIVNELSGPIGIVKMADQLMLDKIKGILILFVIISLFVGLKKTKFASY